MQTLEKPIHELVMQLPPDMRNEVRDFIEFLMAKRTRRPGRKLRQDWAGALRVHAKQYTSLQLQHCASEWRTE